MRLRLALSCLGNGEREVSGDAGEGPAARSDILKPRDFGESPDPASDVVGVAVVAVPWLSTGLLAFDCSRDCDSQ